MPALSWPSLQVVAVDGLVGERGVALRTPLLRDEGGRLLLPSSLEAETVTPLQVLGDDEVRDLLDRGVWMHVRPLRARRDHVVVLRSASFAAVCQLGDDLVWVTHPGGVDVAYVDQDAAERWLARCARHLLQSATRRIGESLAFPPALARAQGMLEQALFATELGSAERRRAFVLLGVIFAERSPASWAPMAEMVLAESPELDRAQLEREVAVARVELKARETRPERKSWASGFREWLQPAPLGAS
jgi:hypothetical protein